MGVEGGYVDFGNPSTKFGIDNNVLAIDADGWNLWGVGGLASESGSDFGYGLGARVSFGKLAVRGEWEVYDIEDTDDISMFSVGLAWRF